MRRPRRRARSNRGVRGSGTPCRDRYARTDSGARGRARRGGRGPPRTDGSGGLVLSVQAERDDGCDAKGVLRVAGATGAIDELADRGATSGASDDELSYTLDIRSPAGSAAIRELVDRARGACHAENSLRVAPVVALRLNGEDQPA